MCVVLLRIPAKYLFPNFHAGVPWGMMAAKLCACLNWLEVMDSVTEGWDQS